MLRNKARKELFKDIFLILIGAVLAIFLARTGVLDLVLGNLGGLVISSFVSGMFFTSAFTLAPASIAFAHLAPTGSIHVIAAWGALGALLGDLILFFFIRDRFADDLMKSLRPSTAKHIIKSFHLGFLKWLSPILGGLIIASPIPDEFGLVLLGLSRTRLLFLVPISYFMNMLGLYLILWFVQAL